MEITNFSDQCQKSFWKNFGIRKNPEFESIKNKLIKSNELFNYIMVPVNLGDDKDMILDWIKNNLNIDEDLVIGVWTTNLFDDEDENAESWILVKSDNLPKLNYRNNKINDTHNYATYRYGRIESWSKDKIFNTINRYGLDGYVEGRRWLTINNL